MINRNSKAYSGEPSSDEENSQRNASHILEDAKILFDAKNEEYGDGYLKHGKILHVLFPNGLELDTESEFGRFAIFNLILTKIIRHTADFASPHHDSTKDLVVYAAMLQELNEKAK